jgi:hypothetical protein
LHRLLFQPTVRWDKPAVKAAPVVTAAMPSPTVMAARAVEVATV